MAVNDGTMSPDELIAEEAMFRCGYVVDGRFTVRKLLGAGSFGQVFQCSDAANHREVALKIEKAREGRRSFCAIEQEMIEHLQGLSHVPRLFGSNLTGPQAYIALQLMAISLADLRRSRPHRRFSLSSALRLSMQCFDAVAEVHSKGILHRDVKPSNFMMGEKEFRRHVFLVDYGLSRFGVLPDGSAIPPRTRLKFVGSNRYASVNAHDEQELGRRDDVISLYYTMVEIMKGRLPWKHAGDRERIGEVKKTTSVQDLCSGLPEAIVEIGKIVMSLQYDEPPPYETFARLLQSIAKDHNIRDADVFDWETKDNQPQPKPPQPTAPDRQDDGG